MKKHHDSHADLKDDGDDYRSSHAILIIRNHQIFYRKQGREREKTENRRVK